MVTRTQELRSTLAANLQINPHEREFIEEAMGARVSAACSVTYQKTQGWPQTLAAEATGRYVGQPTGRPSPLHQVHVRGVEPQGVQLHAKPSHMPVETKGFARSS
jgi:hypothetical protein